MHVRDGYHLYGQSMDLGGQLCRKYLVHHTVPFNHFHSYMKGVTQIHQIGW